MNFILASANAAACQYNDQCAGTLPFTGIDVGFILFVAFALLLVGLVIRNLVSKNGDE